MAVGIDTRDEGSGVQSVDLLYQISEGNGESVIVHLYYALRILISFLYH